MPFTDKTAPNLIVSTHPDHDHIGDLTEVVNHYGSEIETVWVNDIKEHIPAEEYSLLLGTLHHDDVRYQPLLKSLNDLNSFIETVDR